MAALVAYALVWPNDDKPLLFTSAAIAEENRKWFSANYKRNNQGELRGEPRVIELVPREP